MSARALSPLDAVAARSADAPIAQWLNYSASIDSEREKAGANGEALIHQLTFDERHIGDPFIRALHGGVIAAFLEFSAACAIRAETGKKARAINIAIDYLASSKAMDIKARARIKRIGRRVGFLEMTGWQEDEEKPVAIAQFCFRLF